MYLAIAIGFLLLIIPGIIVALGLSYATYFVADAGLGPIEALKASWAATNGSKGKLFLFGIVAFFIALAGVIACCIGIIPAVTLTMLAQAMIYVRLSGRGTTSGGFDPYAGGGGFAPQGGYGAPPQGGYGGPPAGGGYGGPPAGGGYGGPPAGGGYGGPPQGGGGYGGPPQGGGGYGPPGGGGGGYGGPQGGGGAPPAGGGYGGPPGYGPPGGGGGQGGPPGY
jgi:hypothetical protein